MAAAALPARWALAGNHFLTIVEGQENLEKLGKDCLWKGAHDVVFEAYD